jgi:NAD(P)-dependent dehydrogenase (short-subunit alcohol dehydrogenase family)
MARQQTDRVAVITGAGTGIGRETAVQLGALGWRIAMGGRRVERLAETARAVEDVGGQCWPGRLDVTDPDSVEAFFGEVEAQFGTVTAVINNAAVSGYASLEDYAVSDLAAEIATKLIGALYVSRRAIQGMRRAGHGGDVVFVSSMAAVIPWPQHVPYAAANAGVEHAAQTLQLELEGTGIRVTTIRCGNTLATDIAHRTSDDRARVLAIRERWFALGLLRHGNMMEPSDVASAIVSALTLPPGRQYGILEVTPAAPVDMPQTFAQWQAAAAATVTASQAARVTDISGGQT